ncbi:hypothetical protein CRG98_042323 [Punica granatum]|uniref:Uncharacterized protein n=1 Tax=Punica granatum TaxID=22663 RepID=A0A2I0HZZ5_PUNGR|nr:hypothetical protein CRG98_042323 [Punica granatum]
MSDLFNSPVLLGPIPRAFPRMAAHANPESGKVQLCGPQSRSNHSKVVMITLPELSVPHARLPMSRTLNEGIYHRETPVAGEERCAGSHLLENTYRVYLPILQQGRARQGGTPYEADDGSIRTSHMPSAQPSQSTNKHAYRLREHTSPA